MKKKFALFLTLALVAALIAGCAGTPVVYYNDCTCPTAADTGANQPTDDPVPVPEGAVKTGLAIVGKAKSNEDATGMVEFDVTIVAVSVDDNGVIVGCIIDSIGPKVNMDETGVITTDLNAQLQTKNELGDAYNMVTYGQAKAEWYQQAGALAAFAVGKTVEELKNGAIDETGYAPEGTDLASSASIYLGGYVSAIEVAVNNAKHLGAQGGDELKLAVTASVASSANASAEKDGTVQLDCDAMALTVKDGVITSCAIDSLQAKIGFSVEGVITADLTAPLKTKNELGADYNMVAWGQAKAEWNEQAASFAAYVTGKTADEVAGIAVSEGKPADEDLAASVTIAIGGFQTLVAKALQ